MRKNLLVGLLILVLLAGAVSAWWVLKQEVATNINQRATEVHHLASVQDDEPILVYTQQITPPGSNFVSQAYTVFMKIGDREPVQLAVFDKSPPPPDFTLSPDKKSLYVSLGNKIQILDLDTAELRDFFTPKYQVVFMAFSPDKKKIFIYDEQEAYAMHIYDLETQTSKIIKEADASEPKILSFYDGVWRGDNKVLLAQGAGYGSSAWYHDLDDNTLHDLAVGYGRVSSDGSLMAIPDDTIPDTCNEIGGEVLSGLNIIEPFSKKPIARISKPGQVMSEIMFSPYNSQVLYSTYKPNRTDCASDPVLAYHLKDLVINTERSVEDPDSVQKDWLGIAPLTTVYDWDAKKLTLKFDGKELLSAPTILQTQGIGVFFKYQIGLPQAYPSNNASDWTNYENADQGFSLSYPAMWFDVGEMDEGKFYHKYFANQNVGAPLGMEFNGVWVTLEKSDKKPLFDNVVQAYQKGQIVYEYSQITKVSKMSIGGLDGYKYISEPAGETEYAYTVNYIVNKNGQVYNIQFLTFSKKIADQNMQTYERLVKSFELK